jgi:hypothetical protein
LVQKYRLILAADECPQQSHFSILRVMTKILEMEFRLEALKPQKDGEINVGKITGCLLIAIHSYLSNRL